MKSSKQAVWAEGKEAAVIKKLSSDKLCRFFAENCTLEDVQVLDVSSRGVEEMESLQGMEKLRRLQLGGNKLRRLRGMGALKELTYLDASNNQLTSEGVEDIRDLDSLRVLNLSHNQLQSLVPRMFKQLINLQAVMLNNNMINRVRFISNLKSVNTLVLSHNAIEHIPEDVFDGLHQLTKLSLSNNQLTEVPRVERCFSLQELRLSRNQIQVIPDWLMTLRKLKTLDLGFNLIDSWDEVKHLIHPKNKLKQLTLKGNPIETDNPGDNEEEKAPETGKRAVKSYADRMAKMFPKLVVQDDRRVLSKKTHGIATEQDDEDGGEEGDGNGSGDGEPARKPKSDAPLEKPIRKRQTTSRTAEGKQAKPLKRGQKGQSEQGEQARGKRARNETGKKGKARAESKREIDSDDDEDQGISKLEQDLQAASTRMAMSGVVAVEIVDSNKDSQGASRKRQKVAKAGKTTKAATAPAPEAEPAQEAAAEVVVSHLAEMEKDVGLGGPSAWDDDEL